jgi:hypothetical protein
MNKALRHRLYGARLAGRFATVVETFKTDDRDEVGVTLDLGDGAEPVTVYFHREATVDVREVGD